MKIGIVQRKYAHFRVDLFEYIAKKDKKNEYFVIHHGKKQKQKYIHQDVIPAFEKNIEIFGKKYNLIVSFNLIKYLFKEKFDLLILEGTTNLLNNVLIYQYCKITKTPYIWWGAGRRVGARMTPLRKLAHPFIKKLKKDANACLAYSNVAKSYMHSLGVDDEHIFLVQNTLNVNELDKSIKAIDESTMNNLKKQYALDNKKIILYVGAIEKRKRVDELVQAYSQAKMRHSDIALMIVGDGPYMEELKHAIFESGATDIHLAGRIIEEVNLYFKISDLFILPSEGGLALNQAMTHNKPIIASSADGTELDLIQENVNGYIFKEGNTNELSNFIIDFFNKSTQERIEMGNNSRKIINESINEEKFFINFQKSVDYAMNGSKVRDVNESA